MFKLFLRINLSLLIILNFNFSTKQLAVVNTQKIINHLNQCPSVCRCVVEMKENIKNNNLIDTSQMMRESNFKIRTLCFKQQISNLLITQNMSYLSVQL